MAGITDYLANSWLDAAFNATSFAVTTVTVSLHTDDPGGTGADEVVAGANTYARQTASFSAAASKSVTNDADIEWTDMPGVTVTHAAVWDGTDCLWSGELTAPKVVNAGDVFRLPAGEIDITLQDAA